MYNAEKFAKNDTTLVHSRNYFALSLFEVLGSRPLSIGTLDEAEKLRKKGFLTSKMSVLM